MDRVGGWWRAGEAQITKDSSAPRGSDLSLQAVGVSAIETSGGVTRKIDMVTMEDGQVGWSVSFLPDSLPKLGIFGFQQ